MIRGDRAYRVTGTRGTTAYLGVQVLAGTGMTPRRMAAYVSDTDLKLDARRVRAGVLVDRAVTRPSSTARSGCRFRRMRRRSWSASTSPTPTTEQPATLRIDPLDRASAAGALR